MASDFENRTISGRTQHVTKPYLERSQQRTNDNLPQKETTEMVRKEGKDTTMNNIMLNMQVQEKRRRGTPNNR